MTCRQELRRRGRQGSRGDDGRGVRTFGYASIQATSPGTYDLDGDTQPQTPATLSCKRLSQRFNTSKKITDPWRGRRTQAILDLERVIDEVGLAVVSDEDEEGGEDKDGLEIRHEPDGDDVKLANTRWIHKIQG